MARGNDRLPVTTLAQLERLLGRYVRKRQSVVVYGPPGVGKTSLINRIAADSGRQVCAILGSEFQPEDVTFPLIKIEEELIKWVQSIFPTDPDWKGLVFIDEFGHLDQRMQSRLLPLFHSDERRLGQHYKLPDGAVVIAASNRASDGCAVQRCIGSMEQRVNKLDFIPDTGRTMTNRTFLDEFVEYMRSLALDGGEAVIAFLRCYPQYLLDSRWLSGETQGVVGDCPTPRAWTEFASMLEATIEPDDAIIADGKVGPTVSRLFCADRELNFKIDPMDVINHPKSAVVPANQPSLLWATVGAVANLAKTATNTQLDAIVQYLNRCPAEYAVYGMLDAMALNRAVMMAPASGPFIKQFGPLIANKS